MTSAASRQEIEDLAEEAVAGAIDEEAIARVAKVCSSVPLQIAMAAALVRRAASAYAILTSHAEADRLLTPLARRHRERAARQPGKRWGGGL